jgi:hypothetical protein
MNGSIELTGPTAAAAISAAVSIVTEVARQSLSRTPSAEVSNHLAARTGQLARIILEAFHRDPPDVTVAGPDAAKLAASPKAAPHAEPVGGTVGW